MGGDFAPGNVVAGAVEALRAAENRFEVILIGQEDRVNAELTRHQTDGLALKVVHASEVVGMDDSPTTAIKQKKNSSITLGLTLQKEHRAEAFVSAGNTGAVMSASTLILGRMNGVGRPTMGAFLPSENGFCLLLDAGANVDCRPQHLLEFGIMGSIYAQHMMGYEKPTVGLLSVGEESSKGNSLTLEAHRMFAESGLNFVGNVEGRDILKGKSHVVVCDGFVGNVVLKFAESVLSLLKKRLRDYASQDIFRKVWMAMTYRTLKNVLKDFDYQEHGGVPLLGVQGVSIIGHGGSTPKAIRNMILKAEEIVRREVTLHMQKALAKRQSSLV